MQNFYIADLHFGHENIIKHSKRPFSSVEEMDNTLIDNWNSVVSDDDNVYILGDLCFKFRLPPVECLKKLKGHKHLILGNHDRIIENEYEQKGSYPYLETVTHYLELSDNGRKVVLFHYPMAEWNGFYHDSILLYGHIHNNTKTEAFKIMQNIPNAYNVGADIIGYTPRTLNQILRTNGKIIKC